MTTKVCLDLFSGLGGFSQAFEADEEWDVFTVDMDPRFDANLEADVLGLRPQDLLWEMGYEREEIDVFVILASPPCTQFSKAASKFERIVDGEPQTPDAREAVTLVYHTIGLIRGLSPDHWVMENPKGFLRDVIGQPTNWVTYCQYGEPYMKPTDLWGDHPPGMEYRKCAFGDDCHEPNTDMEHGGNGNFRDFSYAVRDPAERAKVPEALSQEILDAVEGETVQRTLEV